MNGSIAAAAGVREREARAGRPCRKESVRRHVVPKPDGTTSACPCAERMGRGPEWEPLIREEVVPGCPVHRE
jgi:hypothetical protein